MKKPHEVVIIGAGPGGLTAAYQLCKAKVHSTILEKDQIVGGLAKTLKHKGFHFDLGGHRFFTKVRAVEEIWREVLPNGDFLRRKRLSRIYYNKKFFYYPLRLTSTLIKLGVWDSLLIALSYLWARISPQHPEETFEQWVTNRFGSRFYKLFFEAYTEKVWGIPCKEITAEWAAQRIKDLSLASTIKNVVLRRGRNDKQVIKTLIEEFDYPRLGPGMMWETMAQLVQDQGTTIRLGADVTRILWSPGGVRAVEISVDGQKQEITGSDFISTMPIRELVQKLDPPAPDHLLQAALNLRYRDFLIVILIVNKAEVFPDNWIYIHDPDVKLGRIQNFKNWSSTMVPDPSKTCLGLEYFCFERDGLWTMPDQQLVELGKKEVATLGLVKDQEIEEGIVVRVHKAYPVYDSTYKQSLQVVREFFNGLQNLQFVGRNGMHKYNNQDHSMLTAMLAVKNILGEKHDLWSVNADMDYHEEIKSPGAIPASEMATLACTQPLVPERKTSAIVARAEFDA
jgi:protoporphyrinogen oxidase